MSLVNINGLYKRFGEVHVLKGINLAVKEDEVTAIIGRSGSGKSTLRRTINGLESFDAGSIKVDGERLSVGRTDLRQLRLKVGMVFQQLNLYPHLTAGKNLMLSPTVVKNTSKREAEAIARDMM